MEHSEWPVESHKLLDKEDSLHADYDTFSNAGEPTNHELEMSWGAFFAKKSPPMGDLSGTSHDRPEFSSPNLGFEEAPFEDPSHIFEEELGELSLSHLNSAVPFNENRNIQNTKESFLENNANHTVFYDESFQPPIHPQNLYYQKSYPSSHKETHGKEFVKAVRRKPRGLNHWEKESKEQEMERMRYNHGNSNAHHSRPPVHPSHASHSKIHVYSNHSSRNHSDRFHPSHRMSSHSQPRMRQRHLNVPTKPKAHRSPHGAPPQVLRHRHRSQDDEQFRKNQFHSMARVPTPYTQRCASQPQISSAVSALTQERLFSSGESIGSFQRDETLYRNTDGLSQSFVNKFRTSSVGAKSSISEASNDEHYVTMNFYEQRKSHSPSPPDPTLQYQPIFVSHNPHRHHGHGRGRSHSWDSSDMSRSPERKEEERFAHNNTSPHIPRSTSDGPEGLRIMSPPGKGLLVSPPKRNDMNIKSKPQQALQRKLEEESVRIAKGSLHRRYSFPFTKTDTSLLQVCRKCPDANKSTISIQMRKERLKNTEEKESSETVFPLLRLEDKLEYQSSTGTCRTSDGIGPYPSALCKKGAWKIHIPNLQHIQRFYQFSIDPQNSKDLQSHGDINQYLYELVECYIKHSFDMHYQPSLSAVTFKPETNSVTILLLFRGCPFRDSILSETADNLSICEPMKSLALNPNEDSHRSSGNEPPALYNSQGTEIIEYTDDESPQDEACEKKDFESEEIGKKVDERMSEIPVSSMRGRDSVASEDKYHSSARWIRHFLSFEPISKIMDHSVPPLFTELAA